MEQDKEALNVGDKVYYIQLNLITKKAEFDSRKEGVVVEELEVVYALNGSGVLNDKEITIISPRSMDLKPALAFYLDKPHVDNSTYTSLSQGTFCWVYTTKGIKAGLELIKEELKKLNQPSPYDKLEELINNYINGN